jgi:hypothetical protein
MKTIKCIILVLIIFSTLQLIGQESLTLQHRIKEKKHKILKSKNLLTFVTNDSIYCYYDIVEHTDSTLKLYKGKDSIQLLISDIKEIKEKRYKNTDWMEPFAMLVIVGGLGILAFPYAAVTGVIVDWLVFEGIILGISLPPVLIGNKLSDSKAEKKYDLKTVWKIVN